MKVDFIKITRFQQTEVTDGINNEAGRQLFKDSSVNNALYANNAL